MIQALISAFYQFPSGVDLTNRFQFVKCVLYLGLANMNAFTSTFLK